MINVLRFQMNISNNHHAMICLTSIHLEEVTC